MSWIPMKGERSLDCGLEPGNLTGVGLFVRVAPCRVGISHLKAALGAQPMVTHNGLFFLSFWAELLSL